MFSVEKDIFTIARDKMSVTVGTGNFKYEAVDSWPMLPGGATLIETPGVAVDSQDEIYTFSRNTEHPVMVFNRDGNFLRGFGTGIFSNRTHGILIGPDDTYVVSMVGRSRICLCHTW